MTEFVKGDRVRYVGNYSRELINAEGTVSEPSYPGNVYVDWDRGQRPEGVKPENIEKITASLLAFVGPEPKPAEAPTVTTPFQVDGSRPYAVVDNRGNDIADFTGDVTSSREDAELAALAVKLLNAHFGAK